MPRTSMKISLEPLEQERYQRQLALDDFSSKDQVLLKDSKVLIVGAGGLGSPIIAYLCLLYTSPSPRDRG